MADHDPRRAKRAAVNDFVARLLVASVELERCAVELERTALPNTAEIAVQFASKLRTAAACTYESGGGAPEKFAEMERMARAGDPPEV